MDQRRRIEQRAIRAQREQEEQRAVRVQREQEEELRRDRLSRLSGRERQYQIQVERGWTEATPIIHMDRETRFAYLRSQA